MRAPAVVGGKVFVTSDEPMLHCIDANSGEQLWEAPHVKQFAAASAKRVYGVDELGALVMLDISNGSLLGRMPTNSATHALVNDQTDRLYLVSKDGVVQCFREIGSKEPVYHQPKAEAKAAAPPEGQPTGTTASPPATATPPMTEEDAEDAPADDAAAESEEDGAAPAGEEAMDDEDPFSSIEE